MPETTEHRKPVRLASAAFQAALAEKWDVAQRALQRISDECGEEGLAEVVFPAGLVSAETAGSPQDGGPDHGGSDA